MKTCRKCTAAFEGRRCKRCEREKSDRWAAANPEKVRAANAKWYASHKETAGANSRKYYLEHKEKVSSEIKKWHSQHPEAARAKNQNRRAKKLKATPLWADKKQIAKIYKEAAESGLHVDHNVPLKSKFVCGLHVPSNLQLLSRQDNQSKGNRVWPGMPSDLKARVNAAMGAA